MYKLVFDNGKPYEETANSEEEIEQKLKAFYEQNKDSDFAFDVKVYNNKGEDISESQFISEIIGEIIEE